MYKTETQNESELNGFLDFIAPKKLMIYCEIGAYAGATLEKVIPRLMPRVDYLGDGPRVGTPCHPLVIVVDDRSNAAAAAELDKVIERHRDRARIETIWGNSQDRSVIEKVNELVRLGPSFPPHGNSLVFIDADHSFNGALSDWINYKDKFQYIAFNDIDPRISELNIRKHGNDKAAVHHLWRGLVDLDEDVQNYRFDYVTEWVDDTAVKPRGIGLIKRY